MVENTIISKDKARCPECKRILRLKHFVYNRKTKTNICTQCDKRIGNNIWYDPMRKGLDRVSKYGMSTEEKKLLVKNGKSWKEVNGDCKYMKGLKKRKNREFWNKVNESKKNILQEEQKKIKLIEGLRNYKG
jgi:hypothetical protein